MKRSNDTLVQLKKSKDYFLEFTKSQQFIGLLLLFAAIFSLTISNSGFSGTWLKFIHFSWKGVSLEWFVNDFLMAFFFLLVGLEIKRELLIGELSNKRTAALPIAGAIGGMLVPALIYYLFNRNHIAVKGWAIPTATDIAFAVGILNLLGNKISVSLKIFVTALAVVDDLGAVLVIAFFYSNDISWMFILLLILFSFLAKLALAKITKLFYLFYIIVGLTIFILLMQAHLHTTLAGVILAIITPYDSNSENSILTNVEHKLFNSVNYFIMPLFAIMNTVIVLSGIGFSNINYQLFFGIFVGLVLGKPIGITLFSFIACKLNMANLPNETNIFELFLVSILGGIGFTMSIFISLLAFNDVSLIEQAKLSVLLASFFAGIVGFLVLFFYFKNRRPIK